MDMLSCFQAQDCNFHPTTGVCYWVSHEDKNANEMETWENAEDQCGAFNSTLAIIDSPEVEQFIGTIKEVR